MPELEVRPVAADQWSIVGWLWQAFRADMAHVVHLSYPLADGRYNTRGLDEAIGDDQHAGYLLWTDSPRGPSPVGFALVACLGVGHHTVSDFWVAPAVRGTGAARLLAADVIARHPGRWEIAFQHDNVVAGAFWRRVADAAFTGRWHEEQRPVPGRDDVPPDHWILTT